MTRNYDLEAKDHPEHRYAYDFDYRMHGYMMRSFADRLVEGNVLELGCFHGHFTQLLCGRFDDVEVVEASSDCIAEARKATQGAPRFHHSTFETFTPSRSYDNIFLIHTLEHLDDRVAVLRRISNWLSNRGRLFVATPNARAASRQIAVNMGLIEHDAAVTPAERAHGHRVTYSIDTLVAELRAAGLEICTRGGVVFKALANFQMDAGLQGKIISPEYLEGCYQLGLVYPDLCASIYCVCGRPSAASE